MIAVDMAFELREAGLVWKPSPGDRFTIPDRGLDEEVFVISNMTIELHDLPEGPVIGFNGTTEWALDDLAKDEAIWLPREDQLRALLGGTFRRMERVNGGYRVATELLGKVEEFDADEAESAYGAALLHLLLAAT